MENEPFYKADAWLTPFIGTIDRRYEKNKKKEREIKGEGKLSDFALGHLYYGLHRQSDHWVFREWAPNATAIYIINQKSNWAPSEEYKLEKINDNGDWEIILPLNALQHGDLYKLLVRWDGGEGERLPSYANRVVQDDNTKLFTAQVWAPQKPYKWSVENFTPSSEPPIIYEAHVGMATEEMKVGTYAEFTKNVLPRIVKGGYNTLQLMAIQEHPFYGSFGYHVSNFFAASSRFGTPDDLKELIDTAHKNGIRVIMDLVQSHAVKNTLEGLGLFAGDESQYFHKGDRRVHIAWDSLCFDYGKVNVIHFLLSNCRYWLDEYKFDGFRFDGVTSMMYYDHGLSKDFTEYSLYFDGGQDEDAITYLYLANNLIHEVKPSAITIAEEMSGMPGLAAPTSQEGIGFDYRMSMGVPDYWIKLTKDVPDENWNVGELMYELTTHRVEEKVISYCESHDQALVGDKTLIFRMLDAEMYTGMSLNYHSINVDRGIALDKMIKLITFGTAGNGYLNFMGNEFGHPEWIDFPREGNGWSYQYARRQWSLVDNPDLKYQLLARFDEKMISLEKDFKILECQATRIYDSFNDKVLAFTRGDLLFVFNFNATQSYTDYGIPLQGKYKVILNTDQPEFGGYGRINEKMTYLSQRRGEHVTLNTPINLYLYLPSRTAIVFKRQKVKGIFDV
ncbi:MAG: alpha amylase C-terminal domain-containing protein [Bacteroidales bacterium]|nr:alpha amylase C-terminal domain-containing protein [Bacteroidales bacterium]